MTLSLSESVTSGPLITTDWPNRHFNFYSMDTEESFLENSKKFKVENSDWIYFDKKINYKFNSQGYRTVEWYTINWQEAVVIFGCSNVLGEGLAEEDTVSAQLSRLIHRPVVNLGVSGTGMFFNFYNSVLLDKNLPTPYAVVQMWPESSRFELFNETGFMINTPYGFGKDSTLQGKLKDVFYKQWIAQPENANTHAWLIAQASAGLWRNKTQYYELSLNPDTASLVNCDIAHWVDTARDLGHPGIETIKQIATQIASNLN